SHEERFARANIRFFADAEERAVRAAEIGQRHARAVPAEMAVQTGHVAILRKENVAPLATDVEAGLGDRKCVARRLASDDERDPSDVALRRRAESLDAVR